MQALPYFILTWGWFWFRKKCLNMSAKRQSLWMYHWEEYIIHSIKSLISKTLTLPKKWNAQMWFAISYSERVLKIINPLIQPVRKRKSESHWQSNVLKIKLELQVLFAALSPVCWVTHPATSQDTQNPQSSAQTREWMNLDVDPLIWACILPSLSLYHWHTHDTGLGPVR